MKTLEPGIYRATVRGVPDQVVIRTDSNSGDPWITLTAQYGGPSTRWFMHRDIADARPLILLDLEDPAEAVRHMRAESAPWDCIEQIADQIEAQTRPPRIEEPEWGQAVRARTLGNGHERVFLRYKITDPDFRWADGFEQYRWADLIDPTLVREGLV